MQVGLAWNSRDLLLLLLCCVRESLNIPERHSSLPYENGSERTSSAESLSTFYVASASCIECAFFKCLSFMFYSTEIWDYFDLKSVLACAQSSCIWDSCCLDVVAVHCELFPHGTAGDPCLEWAVSLLQSPSNEVSCFHPLPISCWFAEGWEVLKVHSLVIQIVTYTGCNDKKKKYSGLLHCCFSFSYSFSACNVSL